MTGPGGGAAGRAVCPQGHASDDPDWCDVCGLAVSSGPGGTGSGGTGSGSTGSGGTGSAARWSAPTGGFPPGAPTPGAPTPGRPPADGSGAAVCAACGAALDGRFCEECGHDSLAPVPAAARVPGPTTGAGADAAATLGVPAVPARGPSAPAVPRASAPVPTGRWRAVARADRAWFEEVRRQDGVDAAALEFPRYVQERRFTLVGPQVAIGRRNPARGTEPGIDLTGLDPAVSAAHALLVERPDGGWDLVDVGSTNGTTLAVEDGPIPPHRPVPLADGAVVRLGAWTTITLTAGTPTAGTPTAGTPTAGPTG